MSAAAVRALRLVRRPAAARITARLVVIFITTVLLAGVFAPWQQNSDGRGRVIAYAPVERQQSIEAPVEGRVERWYVREGDSVKAGDPIVDIVDNDPAILTRLREERDAQVTRIAAAKRRLSSVESRVATLGQSRTAATRGADARARMAHDRVTVAERSRDAAERAFETSRLNRDRQRALQEQGLASTRTLELANLDFAQREADFDRATASLSAARSEEGALLADAVKVGNDVQASIDDASATRASAEADIASANAELARIEVRLARQSTMSVTASRAGSIFRVVARQGGEMVKSGDVLAILVPNTSERAVELSIPGNDIPFVTPGRRVRLQFEGWPAVQFAGWPEVAVGTFGGTVAFVDAHDDGQGRFRVLVLPDGAEPWPDARYLRQGGRVNAWILLDRVRLGYEVWRRINGFPPVMPQKDADDGKSSSKSGGK